MNWRRLSRMTFMTFMALGLAVLCVGTSGCAVGNLVGGMLQNAEYQKLVETPAEYPELADKSVAVVVDTDMSLLYTYPKLVESVTTGVTLRIGRDVPGVQVVHPVRILKWQWKTPQWNAMPYGDLAESLNVDRVVIIDIYEYRLNPPGNRWLWDGACAANIHVIERDGFDPDMAAASYVIAVEFPKVKGVDRSGATASQIETGVLAKFIKESAWLFHTHLEPKYPDKYRPEAATVDIDK